MGTTALVTDSTCYLDGREAAALGVQVVSLRVIEDGVDTAEPDVDRRGFYARLGTTTVSTSQPSPGEFVRAFTAAAAGGAERVLCVTCTAHVSGTHQSAMVAAASSPVPVDVVDSGTISGGLRLVVSQLSRALAGGLDHDEALALATTLGRQVRSTWHSPATGPALGRVPASDGLTVYALDGEVRVVGTARDAREALAKQVEVVAAAAAASPTPVAVGHGDCPDQADALAAALEGLRGVRAVDRYVVGPVVGAHAGAANVGVSWLAGGAA